MTKRSPRSPKLNSPEYFEAAAESLESFARLCQIFLLPVVVHIEFRQCARQLRAAAAALRVARRKP
jgi:hypothetical protein